MKRTFLSLAVVGSFVIATTACNSTRNASDTRDSTAMDSTMNTPTTDTTTTSKTTSTMDTTKTTMPPDTTTRQTM
ncbi:hypothetical protein IWX76_000316 [Pedobacter sp. CAN_A7]|uniref:coproporphyrinogen III oxidase n=1 Tax=Pedobacter sp. CAN_A7 TaxID=2787722 RepID=UPI0018CBE715